jgi:hypothetical protein
MSDNEIYDCMTRGSITNNTPHRRVEVLKYLAYRVSAVDAADMKEAKAAQSPSAMHSRATGPNDTCHAAIGWGLISCSSLCLGIQGNFSDQVQVGWNAVQLTWDYMGQGTDTWATCYRIWYSYDNVRTLIIKNGPTGGCEAHL